MKTAFVISFVLLTTLSGCAWFDQSYHERIIGEYEVGWNDLAENRNISKSINNCTGCYNVLVDSYVYAVGHNDTFIIAKQHASNNAAKTYYYIIDIKRNEKYGGNEGIYGSLDKTAFDSLRKQFNISHIRFDMNYSENP